MYGPPRNWDRETPKRYGPPGRFPRGRSRSPPPAVPDRYPFPEPGPPMRSPVVDPPNFRGPRSEGYFSPMGRPDGPPGYGRPPYREPMGEYYGPPRRGPERPPIDRPPRYDKRPEGDRPDFRPPRYPPSDDVEFYGRRREFPSPRTVDGPNAHRGYPPEEYPPFVPPKEFGQVDGRVPPRRRSPEPRMYRENGRPGYPPRGGWYRGPSPNRWR